MKRILVALGALSAIAALPAWAADNVKTDCYYAAAQCVFTEGSFEIHPAPVAYVEDAGRKGFYVFNPDGSGEVRFYALPNGLQAFSGVTYRISRARAIRFQKGIPDLVLDFEASDAGPTVYLESRGDKVDDSTRSAYWKVLKQRYDQCASTSRDGSFEGAVQYVVNRRRDFDIPAQDYLDKAKACEDLFPRPHRLMNTDREGVSVATHASGDHQGNAND